MIELDRVHMQKRRENEGYVISNGHEVRKGYLRLSFHLRELYTPESSSWLIGPTDWPRLTPNFRVQATLEYSSAAPRNNSNSARPGVNAGFEEHCLGNVPVEVAVDSSRYSRMSSISVLSHAKWVKLLHFLCKPFLPSTRTRNLFNI